MREDTIWRKKHLNRLGTSISESWWIRIFHFVQYWRLVYFYIDYSTNCSYYSVLSLVLGIPYFIQHSDSRSYLGMCFKRIRGTLYSRKVYY